MANGELFPFRLRGAAPSSIIKREFFFIHSGQLSTLSKQFGTAYTIEGRRKRGDYRYHMAKITADSDSRPLRIYRRSTPELESFSTRHLAKQNPSSHGRDIASESTIAQQQTRHPTKCNRFNNNVGFRGIRILGAASAPLHCSRVLHLLYRS
ncbi:hypothetical protein CRG98_033168 [Punica granatum]|uniref:Uncharacterized protein n=1 Tax=Punica granatum TaxID=22663 RepID=A0A2I0IS09_PUNGR|nr:hypothetical protein CRG98_033168 [Punica granatum]